MLPSLRLLSSSLRQGDEHAQITLDMRGKDTTAMANAHTSPLHRPLPSFGNRAMIVFLLGVLALILFMLLTLPGDLLLFPLSGFLERTSQAFAPLAYGPRVWFSPLVVVAISAIVLGRGRR
jgi:hypothetical protein